MITFSCISHQVFSKTLAIKSKQHALVQNKRKDCFWVKPRFQLHINTRFIPTCIRDYLLSTFVAICPSVTRIEYLITFSCISYQVFSKTLVIKCKQHALVQNNGKYCLQVKPRFQLHIVMGFLVYFSKHKNRDETMMISCSIHLQDNERMKIIFQSFVLITFPHCEFVTLDTN